MSDTIEHDTVPAVEAPVTEAPAREPPGDDLRSVLREAYREANSGDAGIGHNGGPALDRDERGRFASRTGDAPEQNSTGQPEADGGEAQTLDAPETWPDADKAHWVSLQPEAKATILRREKETREALADREAKLKEVETVRRTLDAHRDRHAALGLTWDEALHRLMFWHERLESDFDNAFPALAKQYGRDLSQFQSPPGGVSQQTDAAIADRLARLESAREAERMQAVQSEIQAFASDPAHSYFGKVSDRMTALIKGGLASNLKEAYGQAVLLDPDVRKEIQAKERAEAEKARIAEAAKQADEAKRRAVSVRTVSPPGAIDPNSDLSLREELRRAMAQQG